MSLEYETADEIYYRRITVDRTESCSMQKFSAAFGLALLFAFRCACGQDLHAAQACTRLADDAARLSCYDLAMGVTKTPPPAQSAGADNRAKFGDDGRLHTEAKPNVPKNLSARAREVTLLPTGLYRLTLDNGQVWDTTQTDSALVFKSNDAVIITRGWLGGFQVSLAGHNTSVSATRKQ
jgi:hypothetical protein